MNIPFNEYKGVFFDVRVFWVIDDHFTGQFQVKIGSTAQLEFKSIPNNSMSRVRIKIGVTIRGV